MAQDFETLCLHDVPETSILFMAKRELGDQTGGAPKKRDSHNGYADKESDRLYHEMDYLRKLIRLGRPVRAKPGAGKDFDAAKLRELQAQLEEKELQFAARRQALRTLRTP